MAAIPSETQAIIDAFAGRQLFKCEDGSFEGPSTTWTTVSMPRSTGVMIEKLQEAAPRANKRQKIETTPLKHTAVYKFLTMSKRLKDPQSVEALLDAIVPGATLNAVRTASLSKEYQSFCKAKLQRLRERRIALQRAEAQIVLPSPKEEDTEEQGGRPEQFKVESEQASDSPAVVDPAGVYIRPQSHTFRDDLWGISDSDLQVHDEELSDDDLDERIRALEQQFGHEKPKEFCGHDDSEEEAHQDNAHRNGTKISSPKPLHFAPDEAPAVAPFGLEFFADHMHSYDVHDIHDVTRLHALCQTPADESIAKGACESTDPLLQGFLALEREQELYGDYDGEYHV